MINYKNIIPSLLKADPKLEPIYREHMLDNFQEELPHVFFSDLEVYVSENIIHESIIDEGIVNILALLEEAMGSPDPMVQELVSVSFLEHLDMDSDSFKVMKEIMGKNLLAEIEVILKFREGN